MCTSFCSAAGPGRMVIYSLTDSAGGSFSIDKSSGIVVLERILDREVQPAYQITVLASDLGSPQPLSSLVNVTITVLDINDNPPVFERRDQLATVLEDVGVGTEVLRVYAASKDIGTNAEITYSIRSGNEHGKFHINPLTGECTNHLCSSYPSFYLYLMHITHTQVSQIPSVTSVIFTASAQFLGCLFLILPQHPRRTISNSIQKMFLDVCCTDHYFCMN